MSDFDNRRRRRELAWRQNRETEARALQAHLLDPLRSQVEAQRDEIDDLRNRLFELASTVALLTQMDIQMHVFDGGKKPERMTDGAIGFDVYARAVVDEHSKPTRSPLRKPRAEFMRDAEGTPIVQDTQLRDWVVDDEKDAKKYAIALPPGETMMVGLGFATSMKAPGFYWVAPRSGLASRKITIANSPGTVDPDYRGEAGALLQNNSKQPFVVSHGMRIAQVVFAVANIPQIEVVTSHGMLERTVRGSGGFGSTGTR